MPLRRLWPLLVCAALFGLPSCSDDGEAAQEGTDAPIDTVPTGVAVPVWLAP